MAEELLSQCSNLDFIVDFQRRQKVVYSENGNRQNSGGFTLRKAAVAAKRIGVTRLSDISFLSALNFPVYQSLRPNLFYHSKMGQNTGSQGKGRTSVQAKVSCLMESIETFCMEPRNIQLVRASLNQLSQSQKVLSFAGMPLSRRNVRPKKNEELMWTKAFSTKYECEVFIPAELVYFPFNASKYRTKHYFCQGSNGLASGTSLLEASVHALYELIERHYASFQITGRSKNEALVLQDFGSVYSKLQFKARPLNFELQSYLIHLPKLGRKNIPTIFSALVGEQNHFMGWGTNLDFEVALSRSVSEVMQSYATFVSGSREDLSKSVIKANQSWKFHQPEYPSIDRRASKKIGNATRIQSLQQEFSKLKNFLKRIGCDEIVLVNLTRSSVDIPVVKAIVPYLEFPMFAVNQYSWQPDQPESFIYGDTL